MPSFSSNPRVKQLVQLSINKQKQQSNLQKQQELSHDVMKLDFDDNTNSFINNHGLKMVDLSVFDKVKLDAGACIPTEIVTKDPTSLLVGSEEDSQHHQHNKPTMNEAGPVDGPYFKTDDFGRKKLDISKMILPSNQPTIVRTAATKDIATKSTCLETNKAPTIINSQGNQLEIVTSKEEKGIEKFAFKNITERIPTKQELKALSESKSETLGPKWFDMKAADITPDMKQDLLILRNRAALDPKQFYKKDDVGGGKNKKLPKFFQMGTIVESKADFYSGRLTKKERKSTLVEALLEDHEKRQYLKRKFLDIQENKIAASSSHHKYKKSNKGRHKRINK